MYEKAEWQRLLGLKQTNASNNGVTADANAHSNRINKLDLVSILDTLMCVILLPAFGNSTQTLLDCLNSRAVIFLQEVIELGSVGL